MSPEGQPESARRANIHARLKFMMFILTFFFEKISNCNVPPPKKIPFRVKKKKKKSSVKHCSQLSHLSPSI